MEDKLKDLIEDTKEDRLAQILGRVQALKGDKGDKGDAGERGPQGPAGKDGKNGKDGAMGPQGLQGPKGDKGDKGEKGDPGKDGKDGKDADEKVLLEELTKRIPAPVVQNIHIPSTEIPIRSTDSNLTVRRTDSAWLLTANGGASHDEVTLTGEDYITLSGQQITANPIDLDNLSATGTPSASTYLRGDNTWATVAGAGDVTKVGTPVNNQVGVWTGDGTLEGDADLTFDTSTNTLATGIVTVTDDAYGAGWNGSTAVPTKNAVYDKIETLTGGGVTESLAIAYAVAL